MRTTWWTYNRYLFMTEKESMKRCKKDLCACCLNAENFTCDLKLKWVLETPYDIHDKAMNDLLKAYDSNFTTKRSQFNMKFQSKKDPLQSIVVHSKHWGKTHSEF